MIHAESDNAMIFFNVCDKHSKTKVKAVNLNVTFSCNNSNSYETLDDNININNSTNGNDSNSNMTSSCDNGKGHSIVDSTVNANNYTNNTDYDNVIFPCDNGYDHNAMNDESNVSDPMRHAESDNAMIFSNDCDKHSKERVKAVNLNVTFSCNNSNNYETLDGNININNSTNSNDSNSNMTSSCGNGKDDSIVDSTVNANNYTNNTDYDNVIFPCDNGYDHNAMNDESNVSDPMKHAESDNAMIFSNDCDKHSKERVKAVNLNATFSCNNSNNYETLDGNININNSTNGNDSNSNMTSSCDNGKGDSIVDSTVNANNYTNNTDYDNVIFPCNNGYDHNAMNDESNVSDPMRHAESDNAMIFSNDCDKHSKERVKAVNLNATFFCNNNNNYETLDGNININSSTNGNDSNSNMTASCDNGKGHSIVDSVINANNYTDDINLSCDNGNGCKTVNSNINTDISTNTNVNGTDINGTDINCIVINSDINNLINNDSYKNVTFFDKGSANNSVTGVVLNDVIVFPFDDDNISIILDDVTNAKNSMWSNDGDNNITLSCDNDNTNNIASANITNTSEYLPSTSEIEVETETTEHESIHNNSSKNNDKNSSELLIDISSVNTFGCKENNLCIPVSQSKGLQKKNFCYYCKKFQSQIARHLENVHKLESDVKKFLLLPKGNLEQKKNIETIRRKGNFIHNTDPSVNTGALVVCQRPAKNSRKTVRDFTCCAKCKGWFTKNNIRHHFKQCANVSKGRNVQILGRAVMGMIHECASETVRKVLFPVLREDDVTRCIRYDKLLITYANKLCIKYSHQHQQDMIRARLRLLGRFLITLKEINPNIKEFSDIYDPTIYDDCLKTVNKVADFDYVNKKYGAPSVASNIGTYLKHVGNLFITECIKTNNITKQSSTENFLKILNEDYGTSINKIVEENVTQYKRQKKVTLPSMEDIKMLHSYLKSERRLLYTNLKKKFTYKTWQELAKVTLTSMQVFNRRRAGEIERVTIEDFNAREGITRETCLDLYKLLGSNLQQVADKYVRFLIRGKLGRTVPVILDTELVQCIELILKHRKDANVLEKNPYVFGIRSSNTTCIKGH
ncbi:uncharacterized protein [Temnothorax longispinosus]|uniref:uncharacterized protein isoform X2 n=1 Tax=Temnothorax longispinosus TaxID=300112 RepID=UPI003A99A858